MICCLCSNLAHRTLQRDSDSDSDSASGTRCSVNLLVTVKKVFKLLLTVANRSHRLQVGPRKLYAYFLDELRKGEGGKESTFNYLSNWPSNCVAGLKNLL